MHQSASKSAILYLPSCFPDTYKVSLVCFACMWDTLVRTPLKLIVPPFRTTGSTLANLCCPGRQSVYIQLSHYVKQGEGNVDIFIFGKAG